jgi:phosphatidylglycerol:prolipoprotein diacylglycerol transferase
MLTIVFPNINPVIIPVGPLAVTWYSLSYVAGVLIGWLYLKLIIARLRLNFPGHYLEDFITYAIIGIIVGGRMGHVFFYDPSKYLADPIQILKTYEGGMSFHGGLLGIIFAAFLFCRSKKLNFIFLTDLLAIVAPIGLFFGRIANFINAELYGRVTDVPWAVIFPGSDQLPRHPSQLYEAFLEGAVIFIIMNFLTLIRQSIKFERLNSGVFLLLYGSFRVIVEFFREPDEKVGFIFDYITMGQIVSLPMILGGIYLISSSKIDGSRFRN